MTELKEWSKDELLKYFRNELELMKHGGGKIAHDADLHSEWFSEIMKQIYRDAFIHGSKHTIEDLLVFLRKFKEE